MKTISRYIMTLALLITAATGAWAQGPYTVQFKANGNTKTVENVTLPWTISCDYDYGNGELDLIIQELYAINGEGCASGSYGPPVSSGSEKVICGLTGSPYANNHFITINGPFNGTATCTGKYFDPNSKEFDYFLEITIPGYIDGSAVNLNADKTEASFKMPQYDVTATYTIKRDISVDVTATMGDGTNGVRYRVKKSEQVPGKYEPAEMNMLQVLALVAVHDDIEQKDLTQTQDYYCRIYKLDEQTKQPEGDGVELVDFDFAPGLYALKAFAEKGSNYAGETDLSNTFQLFQGYQVEVAAKEFITYYKDEPLYADTETSADAELYTITSVNADQATLSAAIETAPSRTPLLIFNNSDEAKTFLLIPANEEPNLQLTVAPEFIGTTEATTIAASTDDQTNYALNGKAFVFVKNDLPVAANKAWLSINTGVPSARITIVFEDATKIANTNITNLTNGDWYTIDGRKVNVPSKKGIYIMNGKKVVVK
ncbi:hypothetical protein L6468_00180 [Prevotella communis]|uniref:hypothetical protein n=1 Tax=Prevotella communis TaxID=2913614 RepID=UPI001EDA5819|nr:hypothetical protein [Prevotella communis]UKK62231.1 hypothetical protein L6468_00180 [Prevotella communis]UKK65058.1 hypothetical protein L6473_00180 [Prevotella communis]